MTMTQRSARQPGPPSAQRIQAVEGRGRTELVTLQPGLSLLDSVRNALEPFGSTSAVLDIKGGAFGPLFYVMPALSATPDHAAFYSATFHPPGESGLVDGQITFGLRDNAPFLHCHAFWWEANGTLHGGHILPFETIVAAPIQARAWLLDGVGFEARPDSETNFTLFGPVTVPKRAQDVTGQRCFALRLLPNQDICTALEGFCRDHGIATAELRGGVGSLIGAVFEDGSVVEAFATEMYVRSGQIAAGRARLDVALVDHTGTLSEGVLLPGANPILMTLEVVLVAAV